MKQLTKCAYGLSCPGVADPEDSSGELIVTGIAEDGTEVSVRILRTLLVQALEQSDQ